VTLTALNRLNNSILVIKICYNFQIRNEFVMNENGCREERGARRGRWISEKGVRVMQLIIMGMR
jgi:Leu/Phe-tRNA-protein transferase